MNFLNLIDSFFDAYEYFLSSPMLSYLLMFCFVYFIFYREVAVDWRPNLICKNQKLRKLLIEQCHVQKPIYFTFWAFGFLFQTYLGNFYRNRFPTLKFKRELIKLKDNGIMSIDWFKEENLDFDDGKPIVFIQPGLTGCSRACYLKVLIPHIHGSNKIHCCVINNRGRGGLKLKTSKMYSFVKCSDLEHCLNHIKRKHPSSKLIGIGISFGSMLIARHLCDRGESSVVDASILISTCFDLRKSYSALESDRFKMHMNRYLSSLVKKVVRENRAILESNKALNIDAILNSESFRELDQNLTIKMWNYKNLDEYFKDANLKDKIHLIRKPTIFVNSSDDGFQPISSIPFQQLEKSDHLALLLTKRGGHHGFLDMQTMIRKRAPYLERLCRKIIDNLSNSTLDQLKETN